MWRGRGVGKYVQSFGGETWKKETTWKRETQREDEIKIDIKELRFYKVDWIRKFLDRWKLRAVVGKVMGIRFKYKAKHILT